MRKLCLPTVSVLITVMSAYSQTPVGAGPNMAPTGDSPVASTGAGPAPAGGTGRYTPLTNQQKLNRTLGRLIGPTWLLFTGISAGYSEWRRTPAQWGQGSEGYARRFGTICALAAFRQSVLFTGVALDREDLRYPRSERHGFFPRAGDALRQALLSRRDDGSLGFAYARTVSDLGTTMLARAIYPDRGGFTGRSVVRVTAAYLAGREGFGIVREFTPDVMKALHVDRLMKKFHRLGSLGGEPAVPAAPPS